MAQEEIDRRGALECMIWAGTGVLWTVAGGVPVSSFLLGSSEAKAQAATGFTFLQISDSHIGFKAPANPNPMARRGDRQSRRLAAEARLHDPYRRYHAFVEARGIR
jgi:hypothetical protein